MCRYALFSQAQSHLLLESCLYGTPPIVQGPILVNQKKEFESYQQLGAIKAFGSDSEKSQALKSNFPWALQLRCFLHMCRNIKSN